MIAPEVLLIRYPNAKYEPDTMCPFCFGSGEVVRKNGMGACMCMYSTACRKGEAVLMTGEKQRVQRDGWTASRPTTEAEMKQQREAIVRVLNGQPGAVVSSRELAAQLDLSIAAVNGLMHGLMADGTVIRRGTAGYTRPPTAPEPPRPALPLRDVVQVTAQHQQCVMAALNEAGHPISRTLLHSRVLMPMSRAELDGAVGVLLKAGQVRTDERGFVEVKHVQH